MTTGEALVGEAGLEASLKTSNLTRKNGQAMCSLGITDFWFHCQVALWVRIACPFSAPPLTGASLWLPILVLWVVSCSVVSVGSSLCFFGGCLLLLGCVPLLARVSSVASLFSPFALELSVVLLVVCVAVSPSPSVVPGWRPGPIKLLLYWYLLWYLVASCDGLVVLPVAWSVVVLCFLASCCSTAAKTFGPVWVDWFTLYTLGHMLLWALRSFTEDSSS